jgi:NADH-quinone oxidoreductase subunit F
MTLRDHWLLPALPFASYRSYRDAVGGGAVPGSLSPDLVVEQVLRSGLRGRGGAGFPTGIKWRSVQKHACPERYVVCNAAEGEPGTFKDRFLLRRNPYAAIEGMLIAAYAIDAKAVYIAIKASFVKESERLRQALDEMKDVVNGLPVILVEGPEEYLFGEEKAMLNVIEGEGPLPREPDDPPYEHGLFATVTSPNPALVSNVETFAHVPSIIRRGADSFRALGTTDTPGTILFTLSGDLVRPGVYELEAGITLRQLFHEFGGGPRPGRQLRMALSGVSNGVITADRFDTPADFGSLALAQTGLGSAGFVVFDDETDIPRVAQAVARFLYVESCNQCSACKTELGLASQALDAMFDSTKSTAGLIEAAIVSARRAPQGNRCYLPAEGAALIPSLLRSFGPDFEARLASRSAVGDDYVMPKIADFDETTRTFTYDVLQRYKQPNWTYQVPPDVEVSSTVRSSA